MRSLFSKFLERIKKVKRRYYVISGIVLVSLIAAFVWYKWPYQEYAGTGMRPTWNVADNIVRSPQSQIFATAVYNLGYTTFLAGEGPYTVFVPQDKSYNDLSQELKYFLADTQNQASLRQVILFHVVPGRYHLADLKDGMVLTTVQGEEIQIGRYYGQVILNGSSFIETYDIEAKNGIIHTVNGYLIPPSIYGGEPTFEEEE